MRKFTFLVIVYLFTFIKVNAQHNTFSSSYTSGNEIYWYLAEPVDTGYIFVGKLNNALIWAHADSTGNFHTCNTFSFPISNAIALHDNSVIAWGVRGSNIDTISIFKISPQGNKVWATNYAIPSLTNFSLGGICELKHSGNLYISGSGQKKGSLIFGFILETDSSGNLLKSTSIMGDTASGKALSSMGALAIAGDNSCYAIANMDVWHPFEAPDIWIDMIKIDSLLNIRWARTVYSYASSMVIRGNKITTVANPYLWNNTYSNSFFYTYVSNFDTSGNCLKTLIITEDYRGSTGVAATRDGGELAYGERGGGGSTGMVSKLDTALNIQWSKYYGFLPSFSFGNTYSAIQTKDGGYIMACSVENSSYQPTWGYIIKTDSMGHQGCVDSNTKNYTTVVGLNKYRADTLLFNPITVNTNTVTIVSGAMTDTLLNHCYDGLASINNINAPTEKVVVYPNPGHGLYTIQLSAEIQNTKTEIYNIMGEKIAQYSFSTPISIIDLRSQPTGMYLYRILAADNKLIATGKLIIE